MNHVDTSPAMIQGLWRDIRRELGPRPAAEPLAKSDPIAAAGSAAVANITGKAIAAPLYFFAKRRLPSWRLSWRECNEIGVAWGAVIDWLFPGEGLRGAMRWIENILQRYGPVLDAVKTTGRIVGARVINPEEFAPDEPRQLAAPASSTAAPAEKEKPQKTQEKAVVSSNSMVNSLAD